MNDTKDFLLEMDPPSGPPNDHTTRPPSVPTLACPVIADVLTRLAEALRPRPFRKRHPVLFWLGMLFLLLVGLGVAVAMTDENTLAHGERLAVVRVEGMIADTRPVLRWIDTVQRDKNIKGVLLRIDSPGGGAAASQELYAAMRHLADNKPVVASMGSMATSGGLMAAMSADHVVANPSTVTGSIGVRMDVPQVQGLLGKLGIGQETLTTGRFKDAGSITRPMTAEERRYLTNILQDMHDQFILLVAEGRKMHVDKVRALADGRIFTGREARDMGLVDALGGQETAVAYLRKLTGVTAEKLLEQPRDNKVWKEILESALGLELTPRSAMPAFLYLH